MESQTPALTTISEIRWSDFGWGPYNDQNLAGRFITRTFTLPRLAKVQDYFLRQFDGSTPPKYSRFSARAARGLSVLDQLSAISFEF
jgi:hypothetical protein